MKKYLFISFLTLSFVICNLSFAYAVRPLYTEDARVTPVRQLKIESGMLLLTNRDETGIKELITSLKYGFGKGLDVSLDLPYLSRVSNENNYDGLADGNVKIKYNFFNADKEFASFMIGILPGNINPGSTSNHSDINTMLMYANSFGEYTCDLNFGYTFDGDITGAPKHDYIIYNASAVRPLSEIINIMGEVQYSRNTLLDIIYGEAAIGMNYMVNDKLTLDTAIGCGLNENSSSSNFVAGLTYIIL